MVQLYKNIKDIIICEDEVCPSVYIGGEDNPSVDRYHSQWFSSCGGVG